MTDINLAAIRARDTVTMETLPELERLAMTMEDEEMRAAILLVTDRHALLGYVDTLTTLVRAQAEDEGLWFLAATAPEAYLQYALRRLHHAIEGTTP